MVAGPCMVKEFDAIVMFQNTMQFCRRRARILDKASRLMSLYAVLYADGTMLERRGRTPLGWTFLQYNAR
jgi:hypothetical protein